MKTIIEITTKAKFQLEKAVIDIKRINHINTKVYAINELEMKNLIGTLIAKTEAIKRDMLLGLSVHIAEREAYKSTKEEHLTHINDEGKMECLEKEQLIIKRDIELANEEVGNESRSFLWILPVVASIIFETISNTASYQTILPNYILSLVLAASVAICIYASGHLVASKILGIKDERKRILGFVISVICAFVAFYLLGSIRAEFTKGSDYSVSPLYWGLINTAFFTIGVLSAKEHLARTSDNVARRKLRRLKKELRKKENEIEKLKSECITAKQEVDLMVNELQQLRAFQTECLNYIDAELQSMTSSCLLEYTLHSNSFKTQSIET